MFRRSTLLHAAGVACVTLVVSLLSSGSWAAASAGKDHCKCGSDAAVSGPQAKREHATRRPKCRNRRHEGRCRTGTPRKAVPKTSAPEPTTGTLLIVLRSASGQLPGQPGAPQPTPASAALRVTRLGPEGTTLGSSETPKATEDTLQLPPGEYEVAAVNAPSESRRVTVIAGKAVELVFMFAK